MAVYNYAVIDEPTKMCVNTIIWDGIAQWNPPDGCIVVPINDIELNDECEQVNGVWQKKVVQ